MIAAVRSLYLPRAVFALAAAALLLIPTAFSAPVRAPVGTRAGRVAAHRALGLDQASPGSVAKGRPFLWKIEGAAAPRPSYVLGTAHLSHPDVLRLPRSVMAALSSSDVFYNETAIRITGRSPPRTAGCARRPRGCCCGRPCLRISISARTPPSAACSPA